MANTKIDLWEKFVEEQISPIRKQLNLLGCGDSSRVSSAADSCLTKYKQLSTKMTEVMLKLATDTDKVAAAEELLGIIKEGLILSGKLADLTDIDRAYVAGALGNTYLDPYKELIKALQDHEQNK